MVYDWLSVRQAHCSPTQNSTGKSTNSFDNSNFQSLSHNTVWGPDPEIIEVFSCTESEPKRGKERGKSRLHITVSTNILGNGSWGSSVYTPVAFLSYWQHSQCPVVMGGDAVSQLCPFSVRDDTSGGFVPLLQWWDWEETPCKWNCLLHLPVCLMGFSLPSETIQQRTNIGVCS